MDTNTILSAWKQTENTDAIFHVAGQVIIDESLLRQVSGGQNRENNEFSSGYFCTVSGECWGGWSCWPF